MASESIKVMSDLKLQEPSACYTAEGKLPLIVIRYRNKRVFLSCTSGQYGTMTKTDEYIEFDFSECEPVYVEYLEEYLERDE